MMGHFEAISRHHHPFLRNQRFLVPSASDVADIVTLDLVVRATPD